MDNVRQKLLAEIREQKALRSVQPSQGPAKKGEINPNKTGDLKNTKHPSSAISESKLAPSDTSSRADDKPSFTITTEILQKAILQRTNNKNRDDNTIIQKSEHRVDLSNKQKQAVQKSNTQQLSVKRNQNVSNENTGSSALGTTRAKKDCRAHNMLPKSSVINDQKTGNKSSEFGSNKNHALREEQGLFDASAMETEKLNISKSSEKSPFNETFSKKRPDEKHLRADESADASITKFSIPPLTSLLTNTKKPQFPLYRSGPKYPCDLTATSTDRSSWLEDMQLSPNESAVQTNEYISSTSGLQSGKYSKSGTAQQNEQKCNAMIQTSAIPSERGHISQKSKSNLGTWWERQQGKLLSTPEKTTDAERPKKVGGDISQSNASIPKKGCKVAAKHEFESLLYEPVTFENPLTVITDHKQIEKFWRHVTRRYFNPSASREQLS